MQHRKKPLAALVMVILASIGGCSLFAMPVLGDLSGAAAEYAPIITVGTTDSVETALDPAQSYDHFGWEMITSLSSGLVDIRPGSQAGASDMIPALATSWSSSAGGMIWDFTLRQGVTFDGVRPFNATVVKYTFDRNCNLTGQGLAEPDGPQVNMEYGGIIKNVTIMGTYSVRFYLWIPQLHQTSKTKLLLP